MTIMMIIMMLLLLMMMIVVDISIIIIMIIINISVKTELRLVSTGSLQSLTFDLLCAGNLPSGCSSDNDSISKKELGCFGCFYNVYVCCNSMSTAKYTNCVCMWSWGREWRRKRERERETETERDRETDRQTDRQTDREREELNESLIFYAL